MKTTELTSRLILLTKNKREREIKVFLIIGDGINKFSTPKQHSMHLFNCSEQKICRKLQ